MSDQAEPIGAEGVVGVDIKSERTAFQTWWRMWCPDREMPSFTSHIFDAWLARARTPDPKAAGVEREQALMVCPQCEGEGGYPDGVDDDACDTDCTRCGGRGWIVDLAALRAVDAAPGGGVPRVAYDLPMPPYHFQKPDFGGGSASAAPAAAALAPNVQALVEAQSLALRNIEASVTQCVRDWEGSPRGDAFSAALGIVQRERLALAAIQAPAGEGVA